MNNKPNYYAIIPAKVRYDKDLSANAKLLYGEITALCNEKGFCWASNSYFSSLYGVNDRSIQRLLKELKDKKYISIEVLDNQRREIYIDLTGYDKNVIPPTTKFSYPYDKNVTHNNTKNIKSEYEELKEKNKEKFFDFDWLE